jgi:hypothetical protein
MLATPKPLVCVRAVNGPDRFLPASAVDFEALAVTSGEVYTVWTDGRALASSRKEIYGAGLREASQP